jgi:hypothetical protein
MSAPAAPDEIVRIEAALDTLLAAITRRTLPRDSGTFVLLPLADFMKQSPVESLLTDPIGRALRLGVKRLGERLFALGGTKLMLAACYRVAGRDRRRADWRLDIIDKAWDGIGGDAERWVA